MTTRAKHHRLRNLGHKLIAENLVKNKTFSVQSAVRILRRGAKKDRVFVKNILKQIRKQDKKYFTEVMNAILAEKRGKTAKVRQQENQG